MKSKSEIIEMVAKEAHMTQKETERCLNSFLSTVFQQLADGEKIQIRDFGTFSTHEVPARKGRNPKTGEEIDIDAHRRLKFKAAKAFKDYIN